MRLKKRVQTTSRQKEEAALSKLARMGASWDSNSDGSINLLDIEETKIPASALETLSTFNVLESLRINSSQATARGIRHINAMPSSVKVFVNGRRVEFAESISELSTQINKSASSESTFSLPEASAVVALHQSKSDSQSTSTFDSYYFFLGIHQKDQPPNHYRLLGIEYFEQDSEIVSAAADRQMAHLQRYESGDHADEVARLLTEVARARLCLLDPAKKADYDHKLRHNLYQ